jgi:YfiH family protein
MPVTNAITKRLQIEMLSTQEYSIENKNGVAFIRFHHLDECKFLVHSFSTRQGGVSPQPYDSMNLGFTTEDDENNLLSNRKLFTEAIGLPGTEIKQILDLVHGNLVLNYDEIPKGKIIQADGVVTNRKNIPLITTFADCIPILIADPVSKAVGVVHAGWRGTFARIASKAVEKMQKDFGSKPENILAAIGPGIGRCCFEVDQFVNDSFISEFFYWKDLTLQISNNNKWKIDLHKLNERILIQSGLPNKNIVTANLCTSCRKDLFFSYRRDGQKSGRLAAIISRID